VLAVRVLEPGQRPELAQPHALVLLAGAAADGARRRDSAIRRRDGVGLEVDVEAQLRVVLL
jgi:hypothetical protein